MTGTELIDIERDRQCSDKGYDDAHDDGHTDGSLLHAAILLACDVGSVQVDAVEWPHNDGHWTTQLAVHARRKYAGDLIRRLTIAGGLIAAEIDRLLRAEAKH